MRWARELYLENDVLCPPPTTRLPVTPAGRQICEGGCARKDGHWLRQGGGRRRFVAVVLPHRWAKPTRGV